MTRILQVALLLLLPLFIGINASYAEDTLSVKYPTVVLVQLKSEKNRIDAMIKERDYRGLEEVKNDAEEVRKKMILDFTTNYHQTPVYYYMDSNAELIKNKQFDGILMNADGSVVTKPVIDNSSEDYVIVYYGYFVSQPKAKDVVTDANHYVYDWQTPPGKGLVVLNDRYQQIDHFYKLGYDGGFLNRKRTFKKFSYVSKHYDIEYFPFAQLFGKNIGDHYARHRIAPYPSLLK